MPITASVHFGITFPLTIPYCWQSMRKYVTIITHRRVSGAANEPLDS